MHENKISVLTNALAEPAPVTRNALSLQDNRPRSLMQKKQADVQPAGNLQVQLTHQPAHPIQRFAAGLPINRSEPVQRMWLYEVHGATDRDIVINNNEKLAELVPGIHSLPRDSGIFAHFYIVITRKGEGLSDVMINGRTIADRNQQQLAALLNGVIANYNNQFIHQVRTARKLTRGMPRGSFAIGGSLAMQMWQLALNPNAVLHRPAGDIDILVHGREAAQPMAGRLVNENEPGLPEVMKGQMVDRFSERFSRTQMTESRFKGHKVDIKDARHDTRWGAIHRLVMTVIDDAETFRLPLQSPEALLAGLQKKRVAVAHEPDELAKVDSDIVVVRQIIRDLAAFQHQ